MTTIKRAHKIHRAFTNPDIKLNPAETDLVAALGTALQAAEEITPDQIETSAKALAGYLTLDDKPLSKWEKLTPIYQDKIREMVRAVYVAGGFNAAQELPEEVESL